MAEIGISFNQNRINSLQQGVDKRQKKIEQPDNQSSIYTKSSVNGNPEKEKLKLEIADLQKQLAELKTQQKELKATKQALMQEMQNTNSQQPAQANNNPENTIANNGIINILGGMC